MSSRFQSFTNNDDIQGIIKSSIPVATRKKSKWGIKILSDYNKARNKKILDDSSEELMVLKTCDEFVKSDLTFLLPKFVLDVRKCDGSCYPAESLRQIICAIFHYYRYEKEKSWDFFVILTFLNVERLWTQVYEKGH